MPGGGYVRLRACPPRNGRTAAVFTSEASSTSQPKMEGRLQLHFDPMAQLMLTIITAGLP
jgi:hypothetical protein